LQLWLPVCQWAKSRQHGLAYENIKTLYIDPGCPCQNGYVESFHDKFRRESLARELFYTLSEAQVVIAAWRKKFNQIRPPTQLPPLPNIQLHRPA
jgi:putative transposase